MFQHMVVVMTDGQSNVDADQTIPTAQAMHAEGIEVYQTKKLRSSSNLFYSVVNTYCKYTNFH